METGEAIVLTYIANALWMTCVLAALTELLSRLSARTPAVQRHGLWVVALTLAVVLPLAAFHRSSATPIAEVHITKATTLRSDASAPTRRRSSIPAALLIVIPAVFTITRATRLVRALRIISQLSDGRLIRYADVAAPFTAGIRRSVIVLPHWLRTWTAGRHVAIAHEIAHIRRRDFFWNLVQEGLILPLAWHPAALLIKARIDETRELACDDLAARDPQAYGRTLLDIAQRAGSLADGPGLAIAMFDTDCLEKRIRNLVDDRPCSRHQWQLATGLVFLGAVSIGSAAQAVRVLTSTDFAGRWTGSVNGHPFFSMQLTEDGRGTIDNFGILVANDGTIEDVELRPGVAQITNARAEGMTLHIASREPVMTSDNDGPQNLTLDFTITGVNHGEIRIPGSRVKPWSVERR